jgi:hypothetical protein
MLFDIQGLAGMPPVKVHALRLPAADNEGLCHAPAHNRLLIVPKSRLGKGKTFKDTRAVFAFDLDTATLRREPLLLLSVDAIRAFAERQGGAKSEPGQKTGGRPRLVPAFMPSGVAVHPLTSEIFVLSAVDGVLATFDRGGTVTGFTSLDPTRFRQPEGIAFLPNGDLVITNEAAGAKPTLLLFIFKPPSRHGRLEAVPAAFKGNGKKHVVQTVIEVLGSSLAFVERGGRFESRVELASFTVDARGRGENGRSTRIDLRLTPEEYERARTTGIR